MTRENQTIRLVGQDVVVRRANTVIVGAGAAGMGCAVQLVRALRARGVQNPAEGVLVVTGGLALGASRMSGSDKQTYYKMGTSPRVADTAEDFARALTAGGCCHGDTALVEGVCSLRGFYNLVEAGVPFPHDPFGVFVGYKTDHDPRERATSAGPKTSRFMSECLQARAEELGVRIVDKHPVVRFITAGADGGEAGGGDQRRIVAMVCIDRARAKAGGDDLGVALLVAENWVLAAGGPGEIYQSTVYPRGQVGIHGPALLAGLEACNLTESQFGLASVKFRWNVSGTYMQAVPRIFSTDADGGEPREFLAEYFDSMSAMATNIFLKGYQWPFDAQRILPSGGLGAGGQQSSLIDMAVHVETNDRGRRVWMDFTRNPAGPAGRGGETDGWDAFDVAGLGDEAAAYLRRAGATQGLPIDRLRHMNPPAIDIYAENGIDLTREPLEIAVCAQHLNGGFSVDKWWRSNVGRTFVIGEMAGTHGVKRPGGAALNAGQVGAMRAAEFIANVYARGGASPADLTETVRAAAGRIVEDLLARLDKGRAAETTPAAALAEIGERMTRAAAHLRSQPAAAAALADALAQYAAIREAGLKVASSAELAGAVAAEQQCLTHIAILRSICGMFDRGAGSRGSHCILADDGAEMHPKIIDPATGRPMRCRPENEALRETILTVRHNPDSPELFDVSDVPPRPIPSREIAFEPAWAEYRDGTIYEV